MILCTVEQEQSAKETWLLKREEMEERIRNVIEVSFEEWKEVFQLKGDINFKAERSTT